MTGLILSWNKSAKERARNKFPISAGSFNSFRRRRCFDYVLASETRGAFGLPLNEEVILNPFLIREN